MNGTEVFDAARAVNVWVKYIERFPQTDVTLQTLLNAGFSYEEMIKTLETSLAQEAPLFRHMFPAAEEIF